MDKKKLLERELEEERLRKEEHERREFLIQQEKDRLRAKREASQERLKVAAASALVIGEQHDTDPVCFIFNCILIIIIIFYFRI